jgi:hypothetical protein
MDLDWGRLEQSANEDGEFRLHARFWNADLRFIMGDESTAIRVRDGEIQGIRVGAADEPPDLTLSAPVTVWEEMLKRVPRPFYQDLLGAAAHHGLSLEGTLTHRCSYFPAVRRLVELMRAQH